MCTTAGGNTQPRWQTTTAGDAVVTATVKALLICWFFFIEQYVINYSTGSHQVYPFSLPKSGFLFSYKGTLFSSLLIPISILYCGNVSKVREQQKDGKLFEWSVSIFKMLLPIFLG